MVDPPPALFSRPTCFLRQCTALPNRNEQVKNDPFYPKLQWRPLDDDEGQKSCFFQEEEAAPK